MLLKKLSFNCVKKSLLNSLLSFFFIPVSLTSLNSDITCSAASSEYSDITSALFLKRPLIPFLILDRRLSLKLGSCLLKKSLSIKLSANLFSLLFLLTKFSAASSPACAADSPVLTTLPNSSTSSYSIISTVKKFLTLRKNLSLKLGNFLLKKSLLNRRSVIPFSQLLFLTTFCVVSCITSPVDSSNVKTGPRSSNVFPILKLCSTSSGLFLNKFLTFLNPRLIPDIRLSRRLGSVLLKKSLSNIPLPDLFSFLSESTDFLNTLVAAPVTSSKSSACSYISLDFLLKIPPRPFLTLGKKLLKKLDSFLLKK